MERKYIGIDCGLNGGIAFLEEGELCTMPMPTVKLGKGRDVDIAELKLWFMQFQEMQSYTSIKLIIEDPGPHAASASGLRSMTRSFAITQTLAVVYELPYETVLSRNWQKEFWTRPKMPKGKEFDTKAAALATANKIWPGHDWTKSERSTKPHDGKIDAALLAEAGRRRKL